MNKFQFKNLAEEETVELDMFSEIGENFFGEGVSFENFFNELKQYDGKKLIINLDSPGGSVSDGFAIANAIKQRNGETICRVYSMSASIATQIMLACDRVECFRNSLIMIHLCSGYAYGNKNDFKKQIEIMDKIDNLLADAYVERTGKDKQEVLDLMSAETWYSGSEALEIGLVDSIIDSNMTAKANISIADLKDFKNIPKALINKEEEERKAKEEAEKKAKEAEEEAKKQEIIDRMNMEISLRLADLD